MRNILWMSRMNIVKNESHWISILMSILATSKKEDMRIFIFLMAAFIFSSNSYTQSISELGLKGEVSFFKEKLFEATQVNAEITKGKPSKQVKFYSVAYDTKGKITEKTYYYENDQPSEKQVFSYDEKGNKMGIAYSDWDNKSTGKMVYVYDAKGNNTEISDYDEKGHLMAQETFNFDERGHLIEYKSYEEGVMRMHYSYTYNERGQWIEQNYTAKLSEGTETGRSTTNYDEKGNRTSVIEYYSASEMDWVASKYDKKGHLIEEVTYYINENDTSMHDKQIYQYDKNGNKIDEKTYSSNGELTTQVTFTFDKNGNEIKRTVLRKGESTLELIFKYTYDKTGNWTQKINFRNGKAEWITEREIKYH